MPDKTQDDLATRILDALEPTPAPIDPVALARRDLQKALPRRFYKEACTEVRDGAFVLLLDGRPAKTPAKNSLAVPTLALGEALAAEWARQVEVIDPADMPLTRIVNSAIDGGARDLEAILADIAKYGASDLVFYRACEPEALVAAQSAAWDPYLAFARETLGARFVCAEGVIFIAQPEPSRAALRAGVERLVAQGAAAPFRAAALHVMTTLTGSALIALAVASDEVSAAEAWAAAHVDEEFQMELWGADEEALERKAHRWREMEAAALLWQAVASDPISPSQDQA